MAILILCLSLLATPTDQLREKVSHQLSRIQNIQAEQNLRSWGPNSEHKWTSRVLILRGVPQFDREQTLPYIGIRPRGEPYSFLHQLPMWPLTYREGKFTFKSFCPWIEVTRLTLRPDDQWKGFVPCEGTVYVDSDFNLVRIEQQLFPARQFVQVRLTVNYKWVQLRQRVLLPDTIEMSAESRDGKRFYSSGTWDHYQEFYASEPIIKEVL